MTTNLTVDADYEVTPIDDTAKGLTLGDPDGPMRFVDSLGCEVPTYINPRKDLLAPNLIRAKDFKTLDYHVPFKLRHYFTPSDWPERYRASIPSPRTDAEGYVLCGAITKSRTLCAIKASNRSHFCINHGGALHPADKKISRDTLAPIPQDRIERLTRVQKFLQRLLPVEELDDDEIKGGFIRDDDGRPVKAVMLGLKFEQQLAKELHARLNRFLQSKASDMLNVMVDIAMNDMYEAADRIKAAQWVAERTMGKTPDVIIHGKTELPYESILAGVEAGLREEYRKSVTIIDAEPSQPYKQIESAIIDDSNIGLHGESGSEVTEIGYSGSTGIRVDESGSEDGSDTGNEHAALERAEEIVDDRAKRLDRLKRIRKGKQRRFAARAVGAQSLSDQPWLVEFVKLKGKNATGYKVKLWPPDEQTEAVVNRCLEQELIGPPNEDELRAEAQRRADEEVAALESKLASLQQVANDG